MNLEDADIAWSASYQITILELRGKPTLKLHHTLLLGPRPAARSGPNRTSGEIG